MSFRDHRAPLASMLEGIGEPVARMATAAAVLVDARPEVFWAGFYLPRRDGALVVGPYQGPPACLVLPAGKGVCGAAMVRRVTVVVPDVHAFPDHISCSPRSRSEIVVPLLSGDRLLAVLDLDADRPNAFDEADARDLEDIARLLVEGWQT